MEEFTSIAIWLMIAILTINATIIWFGNQPTFTDPDLGLSVPGVTSNSNFRTNDLNALKEQYYTSTDVCSTATANLLDFGPCVFQTVGNIFKPVTNALNTVGAWVSDLWNWAFAWMYLLQSIFSGVPGGDIFATLLTFLFAGIELTAIVVILLKVAGIIRGGS